MVTRPIQPDEVTAERVKQLPDEVLEVFNFLIIQNLTGNRARILQKDIVERLLAQIPGLTWDRIREEHLLDVEDAYRAAGWQVEYDKPGFNESYEPSFTFTRSGKHRQ